jgi:hypothetical protein
MVTEGYAYLNGTDPEFWLDEEMIRCDNCERKYDYKQYRSETCFECESEGK